jgi:ribosomal protein L11 methyltransferase
MADSIHNSHTWFAVTLLPNDAQISNDAFDGICSELIALGALGTAVDCAPEITCYLEGDRNAVDAFTAHLPSLGCSLLSINQVVQENWTGACPDVWEPIHAGGIEVVPVESAFDPRPVPTGAIKIIPGLGFGTGHHATTRMVLTALDAFAAKRPNTPLSIIDIGTGSGILAIAAAKLFGVAIDAIDIDTAALENARDNVAINHVEHLVKLSTTPLDQINESYNLILANIYGEVLMSMAPQITKLSKWPTTAILSGMTEIVWQQVQRTYNQLGWSVDTEYNETDWVCAVMTRQ